MAWFRSSCQAVTPHETISKLKGRTLRPFEVVSTSLVAPLTLGVFVLTGCVAQGVAGPATILAVVFAALVTLISGFCYTEFTCHFPSTRGPSSYVFTLSGAGRLTAFLVTWHVALDFVIGAAIASRGARAALDLLINGTLSRSFQDFAPLDNELTSPYVDFLALVLPLLAAGILVIFGREFAAPKVSAFLVSLLTILFIIVAGSLETDNANWSIKPGEEGEGSGGFLPFGLIGVVEGAAILTFSFLGFDLITAPGRRIQGDEVLLWGTSVVSIVTCVCLLSVGVVLTFMKPFHLLDGNSGVVGAFSDLSWPEAQWIIGIAIFYTLLITVVACIAGAAKFIGALEDDRMLWPLQRSKGSLASLPAIILIAIAAGLIGAFFQERHLAYVLWSGSVLSLAAVPASLLIFRCRCEESSDEKARIGDVIRHLLLPRCSFKARETSSASSAAAATAIFLFFLFCCATCAIALHTRMDTQWAWILLIVFAVMSILALVSLSLQPNINPLGSFAVPIAPLIAGVPILGASCMLVSPSHSAPWIRLGAWTILGVLIFAISWRGEKTKKGGLTSVMQENGKSSPLTPRSVDELKHEESLEDDSGFSLDIEQCSSSGGSHEPSSGHHTELNITDEIIITETLQQKESEEDLIQTESEIDPIPQIEEITTPHSEFDESKWNSLWEETVSQHSSAAESDKSSIETVAQVHESSTEDLTPQQADQTANIIVVEVPGGALVGEETSSDEDISVSPPPLPPPLPPLITLKEEVRRSIPAPIHLIEPDDFEPPRPLSPVPPPPPLPINSPPSTPKVVRKTPLHLNDDLELPARPISPIPPPLPINSPPSTPRSITPELSAIIPEGVRTPTQLTGFQEELRNTLKLRNQKKIDEIENTVLNVSEGIEIFGGRRSRTTSINKPSSSSELENNNTSIKSAMKAGKFEDPAFVNKLNTILKGQVGKIPAEKNIPARTYPRNKKVVLVAPDDPPVNNDNELAERMQLMKNTLSQLLEVRRDSILPTPTTPQRPSTMPNKLPIKNKAPAPPPAPAVNKTLDFFGTDLQIISKD